MSNPTVVFDPYADERPPTARYFFELSVANTARSLINWLSGTFGGTEKLSGAAPRETCLDQWAWVARGQQSFPIPQGIKPFLVVKRAQADVAFTRRRTELPHLSSTQTLASTNLQH